MEIKTTRLCGAIVPDGIVALQTLLSRIADVRCWDDDGDYSDDEKRGSVENAISAMQNNGYPQGWVYCLHLNVAGPTDLIGLLDDKLRTRDAV